MIRLPHTVNGESLNVLCIETLADVDKAVQDLGRQIAVDTETTGLNPYASDFKLRTVQIGTGHVAYVFPLDERSDELISHARDAIALILRRSERVLMHNAAYDLIVLDRAGLLSAPLLDFQRKVGDTYLMAHLLDPRDVQEHGSAGLSLKGLSSKYVDWDAADTQNGLTEVFRKEFKRTKDTGWSAPGLTQHPTYLLYAGLDVIYTARLYKELLSRLKHLGMYNLYLREQEIANITLGMEANGVLLDVDYTRKLVQDLHDESAQWQEVARSYGVENVYSTDQVVAAFLREGITLTKKTPKGNFSVGKDVLLPLAGLTPNWEVIEGTNPHPLAEAVARSKRADKWRVAYAEQFLERMDSNNRVHADIKSLAARTARFSISTPPLQQLPSGEWLIRRCFLADEGHKFISTDFSQIELRVLAALANVEQMKEAIASGADLHDRTATLVFGKGFTPKQRKLAKNVGFAYVYGGGPKKIADTAGVTVAEARKVVRGYERAFPEVPRYSEKLQEAAEKDAWCIWTEYGRRLPVSPDKRYAALNYCLAPGTRILTSELLHIPCEDIQVGMDVVGFDEFTPTGGRGHVHRRFRKAKVEAVSRLTKPSVRITDATGQTVECSVDHLWLVKRPGVQPRYRWARADQLTTEDRLLSIGLWEPADSRTGGYLAGLYDGEGSMQGRAGGAKQTSLHFSQKPGTVMSMFCSGMDELGLRYSYSKRGPNSTSPCDNVVVHGVPNILKVLGTLRPARFLSRAAEIYDGAAIVGGRQFDERQVVSVEPIGYQEVVAIQTSTRTLIADGYMSHNCIQSTARDIFADALLKLYREGMPLDRTMMPVHDELVHQAPLGEVAEQSQQVRRAMQGTFHDVTIDAESDVAVARSWGSMPDYKGKE